MNFEIVSSDAINLIGIHTRTDNSAALTDIPLLWQRFYSEDVPSKIPDKINNDVLAVYTDYEGDHTKPYTLVIGCKVKNIHDVPAEMISLKIPSAKYAVFKATGELPQSIIDVWKFVWASDLKRSYKADFELYKTPPPQEAEVFIGIN